MGFVTKTFYLLFIILTHTIQIASSADDITRYCFLVIQNASVNMVMLRAVAPMSNETDCSSFKVPKINPVCEAGIMLKDFSTAMGSGILQSRAATCFPREKGIHYAGLFLIEGEYDEEEVLKQKINEARLWRKTFGPLKVKSIVGKNVSKENMELYEWAKMNFARKGFENMNLAGHMKWTTNVLKLFYTKENDDARTAFGCRGYDFNYVEDHSAGLLHFDNTILGYIAEKSESRDDFENPCDDRGTNTQWDGRTVTGTGKYEECYELVKEIYSSNTIWKIYEDKYKGSPLLGLEALNTLFRSILIGNLTSKEFFKEEALAVCAGAKGGANSWANCGKLAFADYLVHEKFCCINGESYFKVRESAEEGQTLKKYSWLTGYVVVDHSFRFQTQCCKHRLSTAASVRPDPFYGIFTIFLLFLHHCLCSIAL